MLHFVTHLSLVMHTLQGFIIITLLQKEKLWGRCHRLNVCVPLCLPEFLCWIPIPQGDCFQRLGLPGG